jgi:hypothetical protein
MDKNIQSTNKLLENIKVNLENIESSIININSQIAEIDFSIVTLKNKVMSNSKKKNKIAVGGRIAKLQVKKYDTLLKLKKFNSEEIKLKTELNKKLLILNKLNIEKNEFISTK